MHGWIVLDKPVGPGSTQCVAAVKRALREGGYPKAKVGHGGTLDPLASGVLPVALGEATKLAGRMLDSDKSYAFTIGFGIETDTLDAEGRTVTISPVLPSRTEIEAALPRFTGPIEQAPPAYSALKIDGERAYARARAGEAVEMKTRQVRVHSLEFLPGTGRGTMPVLSDAAGSVEGQSMVEGAPNPRADPCNEAPSTTGCAGGPPPRAGEELSSATLLARVSKGTYVRSLARDIARALGSVGHVTMLRRLAAGPFTLDQAISLDKLGELAKAHALEDHLLPLTAGLDDIPALPVTPDQAGALRQGRKLIGIAAQPGLHLATERDVPVALVEAIGPEIRVVRGFNLSPDVAKDHA